ncbi:Mce-associated membrane protein [Prauserella aidingensis]|uniref:hypothetical protein n=1 Tax=Prauserella aidingensis TaxID=387890 RepID=UPI0020A2D3C9|nr:hypothetical protein [Prauserella aidingensis]MCP2253025.1 Mce-associated membrane protein [Prauserella aidingensis]
MPPNRRKPTPQPRPTPTRRPKVAGLRKPGSAEDVEPTESAQDAESVEPARPTGSAEASAADTDAAGRVSDRGGAAASEPEDETGTIGDREHDGTEHDGTEHDGTEHDGTEYDGTDEADEADDTDGTDADDGADAAESAPRPGPRRKAKDGGRAKPASLDEAETLDAEEPGTPAVAVRTLGGSGKTRRKPGYVALAALLVVGLVLAGAAVFFQLKGSEARAATSNSALVDGPATSEVKEAMEKAAERLFSIDHNNLGKTEKAANELFAGGEVKQKYDALMGEIKRLAPDQKIVVTVHATRSAVVNLDGDRARVMVFIDQAATRPQDEQPAVGGAAMWLETQKQGDAWKVTNLDTYAAQQPAPAPGQSQDPSGAPLPGDGQQGGQQGGQNSGQNGGQQGGQQGGQNGGDQGGN